MNTSRKLLGAALLAALLTASSVAPLMAQPGTAAGTADTVTNDRDDDGFDWGLLGLLGLLGLIPRKRHDNVHHDTTARR